MTTTPRTLPSRRQAVLALSALTALTLTACSGSDGTAEFEEPGKDPEGGTGAEGTPEPSDGGGTAADDSAEGTAPQSVDVVNPDEAIATISYALPSSEVDGTMTVGLHHLKARGEALELLLTFTPEFSESGEHTLYELHANDQGAVAPALYDRVNLKRYGILSVGIWDSPNTWSSKQAVFPLASGDTQAYWANFALPEDDIDVIDVAISSGPPFEDVTIDWGTATPSSTADGEEG